MNISQNTKIMVASLAIGLVAGLITVLTLSSVANFNLRFMVASTFASGLFGLFIIANRLERSSRIRRRFSLYVPVLGFIGLSGAASVPHLEGFSISIMMFAAFIGGALAVFTKPEKDRKKTPNNSAPATYT